MTAPNHNKAVSGIRRRLYCLFSIIDTSTNCRYYPPKAETAKNTVQRTVRLFRKVEPKGERKQLFGGSKDHIFTVPPENYLYGRLLSFFRIEKRLAAYPARRGIRSRSIAFSSPNGYCEDNLPSILGTSRKKGTPLRTDSGRENRALLIAPLHDTAIPKQAGRPHPETGIGSVRTFRSLAGSLLQPAVLLRQLLLFVTTVCYFIFVHIGNFTRLSLFRPQQFHHFAGYPFGCPRRPHTLRQIGEIGKHFRMLLPSR